MGVPLACLWRAFGVPTACHGHVLVENYISTRSAHFSTVFFHTCLKLGNRQSGQAVFAWGRDFHTLFHTLWKTGFCGFVAGCRTGVGYDIFCDFCIIGVGCLLCYLVNRVILWGAGGQSPADLALPEPGGGLIFLVARLPFALAYFLSPIPPTPFPAGRGRFKVYFAGGYRPRHPCNRVGSGTGFAFGKWYFEPFGKKVFHRGQGFKCGKRCRYHWRLSLPDTYPAGSASTARVQAPGMQGAKPLAQNNL